MKILRKRNKRKNSFAGNSQKMIIRNAKPHSAVLLLLSAGFIKFKTKN